MSASIEPKMSQHIDTSYVKKFQRDVMQIGASSKSRSRRRYPNISGSTSAYAGHRLQKIETEPRQAKSSLPHERAPIKPIPPQNDVRYTRSEGSAGAIRKAPKPAFGSAVPPRADSGKRPVRSAKQKTKPPPITVKSDDSDSDSGEQDVMLTNVPSIRDKIAEAEFTRDIATPRETHKMDYSEIMGQCQESDPLRVFEIDLHACHINKIENLSKFKRVRLLDLSCNYIKLIENLQANQDVRELKLYGNHIVEIDNLESFKELVHLHLQHNRIKTVGRGLQTLRKLKMLRLDTNYIHKLEVRELAGCHSLTSLDLSNNRLDSVAAISCLPNLEELFVSNNRLRTIQDLSRCKKLQEVDVSYNRVTDLSGLKALTNLSILNISNNQLASMKTLGKLKCLIELLSNENRLIDCQPLVEFYPALEFLDISNNHIEHWREVCSLQGLPELVELYVSGNPFGQEKGEKPMYFQEIHSVLPKLDILDGAHMKRAVSKTGTPLMRPMSASTVLSSRQVETQLQAISNDLSDFERQLSDKFESLRETMQQLPLESPREQLSRASSASSDRPASKSGKRSRLLQAKEFASMKY